ncbi:MAG: hypothetical protein U9O20_03745 [Patescibacteria group bacterium]|nr:hypothetical protein [Patescibacteria group bacterium]
MLKIKKVRKEAGVIKIDLVDLDDIAKELNLIVGVMLSFVFPECTKFYIDLTVLNEEYIDISSSDLLAGIELLSKDLVAIIDAKVCDIISANS